jgi:hypothetical protein
MLLGLIVSATASDSSAFAFEWPRQRSKAVIVGALPSREASIALYQFQKSNYLLERGMKTEPQRGFSSNWWHPRHQFMLLLLDK